MALEEEQFEQLPGGVFNKGIVRSYARFVGLDEEEWVNRYMAAYQQSGKLKFDDADWMAFAENVSKTREVEEDMRPARKLRWAGVAVLLLILVGLGWFVWRYVHGRISEEGALHPAGISSSCVVSAPHRNISA
jgi:cytoskeleton protein RodZ